MKVSETPASGTRPFGADPDDRMTQEYENLDGQAAHRDLLSQLMMPKPPTATTPP